MRLSILLNCYSANSLPSNSAPKRKLDRLPTDDLIVSKMQKSNVTYL